MRAELDNFLSFYKGKILQFVCSDDILNKLPIVQLWWSFVEMKTLRDQTEQPVN
jgi:hypothetical protein